MTRRLFYRDRAAGHPFHIYAQQPDFAFPPHCHDYWEAFLCVGGRGVHEWNGAVHALAAGDLWILRPDDVHSVRPIHEFAYINIVWLMESWEKWCDLAGVDVTTLGHSARAPQLESLLRDLMQPRSDAAKPLALCRLWAEIALTLRPDALLETRPDWMVRALQALETEAGLRAGWPLLLRSAHVSSGHLCREWEKAFGQTPTQWINARRLENAAQLLLQSNLAIEEIGRRCGFDNPTYFYRLFGRKFGLTPRAYRMARRA